MENEKKPTQKQLEDAHSMIHFLSVAASVYSGDSYLLVKATRQEDGKIIFSLISSSIDVGERSQVREMLPRPDYVG